MTSDQLMDMLVAALVRQYSGSRRRWRVAIGPMRIYDVATHPHCNWAVDPSGTVPENAAIERLLDDVRGRYPILSGR